MPFFSFIDLMADLKNRNKNSASLVTVCEEVEESHADKLARLTAEAEESFSQKTQSQAKPGKTPASSNRRLFSILCHGSIWLNWTLLSIGIPIVIFFVSDDPIVKANAKESLNAHINILLCYFIFSLLMFAVIGVPLLAVTALYHLFMPLIAIFRAIVKPEDQFEYPWTLPIISYRMRKANQSPTVAGPTVIVIERPEYQQ